MKTLLSRFAVPSKNFFLLLGVWIFAVLVIHGPLSAQSTSGSITGAVTDPSGAAIPGVRMTLTNIKTGAQFSASTSGEGVYHFFNLVPAPYELNAEKSGFTHFRESITITVGTALSINVPLTVGAVTQNVTVSGATPELQPETSSLGHVISGRQVTAMPLNGRNVYNLMTLVPSVVPQGSTLGTPVAENSAAWNNYQINGGFAGQSIMFIDNSPINITLHNDAAFIPPQDFIEEFKVETSNLGPQWGRFAGGVMNLTTKSGGNTLHATAYEYLRNKVLNANTFFSNRAGIVRPPFTQNQFGANAGGPVYIPHLYNGHNKTFWFTGYEGYRLREGETFVETVPTQAERAGDFSNLRNSSGALIPIYNPYSVCGNFGNAPCAVGAGGQPIYTREAYPNNVIPSALISPTALKVESLWPLPNAPGEQFTNINNYIKNASAGGSDNSFIARIDQIVSDKQLLFVRFLYWNDNDLPLDPLGTGACVDNCSDTYKTWDTVIGDTYTFSPTTFGEFHISGLRYSFDRTPIDKNFDLTSIGWPALLNTQIPAGIRTPPSPIVSGEADGIIGSGGLASDITARINVYDLGANITKVIGAHTLKFGGEYHIDQDNYVQASYASGSYSFNSAFTSSSPINGTGGFSFASYLAGTPASGSATLPSPPAAQMIYRALYIGDTWRVTQKLTLNLGLRYGQQGPWSERYNRLSVFDPTAPSTLQGAGLNLHGQFALVDSSLNPGRNNRELDKTQFAPRLGFGYQLTPSTVIRGGYGIFWLPDDIDNSALPNNDAVNNVTTPMIATIDGGITPYNTFNNPFPAGLTVPTGRPSDPDQFCLNLGGCSAPIYKEPYGYMQQWNLDVQRQLPANIFVDAAYSASKGTHLPFSRFANQLPDSDLALGTALLKQVPNPFLGMIQSGPLATATVAAGQLLRPFPQYSSFNFLDYGFGISSYNSFQLAAHRPFKDGGTLLLAYTWSKLISNVDDLTSWLEGPTGGIAGIQDWNNLGAARTLSSDDIPQRLVISYVLNLPIGRNYQFLSNLRGVPGKLVSGWGVDGITTFQSGFPLKLTTSTNLTNSFGGGSLPNVVCAPPRSMPGSAEARLSEWFDTACFAHPPSFTFGNEPRVDSHLRQQGIKNFDFALVKNTTIGANERYDVQFRTEFFNLFNIPEFGPPGTSLGTAQFGVVSSQVNNPRLIQFALRLSL